MAEAYQEAHPDHQPFADLDEQSSLYIALVTAFGGSSGDYIADKKTIRYNQDEIKTHQRLHNFYSIHYTSAFGAAT